jgi:hypothetical protein
MVCRELLEIDAVLISEAQDLPPEFFQLVNLFTRNPERIVWACGEMQKLSRSTKADTGELFGTGRGARAWSIWDTPPKARAVPPSCRFATGTRPEPWRQHTLSGSASTGQTVPFCTLTSRTSGPTSATGQCTAISRKGR